MTSTIGLDAKNSDNLEQLDSEPRQQGIRIVVGMASCGIAAGASPVLDALADEIAKQELTNVTLAKTGCIGMCRLEPIAEVTLPGQQKITYVKVNPDIARAIVTKHLVGGTPVDQFTVGQADPGTNDPSIQSVDDISFYKKQLRIALRNCGLINPENIDEYLAVDGYLALRKALVKMSREEVIDEIRNAGLRGRGGAGFSTGLKWQFAFNSQSDKKYVCCNADEGDPGAFMDRSVLEGDPHSVLEAMAIAGYAIGSDQGYIYVRAEYPVAVKRLEIAIAQAKEAGLLGDDILGTGFNFDIEIRLGAGAFVCGEETALLTSIEGNRGEPRPRPPFPAVKGLFGKPTILNNVETYANICQIILNGAEWYTAIGTERSKGTKVFALGGKINNPGLVEVPMGTPLRDIIYEIGGGIPDGKEFKAVQTGGPSGGCLSAELIDTEVDFDNLVAAGSMMGSGGMIVMDEDNCMVDIARFFLDFTVDESCGKCTPCRIGTRRMLEILERITNGKGVPEDIDRLESLAKTLQRTALCALGQTAPNPVLSTLKLFRHEYEQHIQEQTCDSGVCQNLQRFFIDPEKCTGCMLCARGCPTGAINGWRKEVHVIVQEKCIKCGVCLEKCKPLAIFKK